MKVSRRFAATFLTLVAATIVSDSALAAVSYRTITSAPLRINVGADNAFQVFNADVPGAGQIYPSSCTAIADMGVFAEIDGVLYAPDFANHGCGTATASLGEYTPWSARGLSAVSGTGTRSDPLTVTVESAAGNTGVTMGMTVRSVFGQGFFRISKTLTANRDVSVRLFEGADIYLAASDNGIFYRDSALNAPGGQDCAVPPTYTILMIPLSAASQMTASHFADVWRQIGGAQLDGIATAEGCIDNGAALQWNLNLRAGETVTIDSAMSFGDIPSPDDFRLFGATMAPEVVEITNADTAAFTVTTYRNDDTFDREVTVSIPDAQGFGVSVEPATIARPGVGSATIVFTPNNAFPREYVIPVNVSAEGESHTVIARIRVVCEPPFILSLPTHQPESKTVPAGTRTTLSVNVSGGTGPFRYQWYEGAAGSTAFPVRGVSGPEMTTPPINSERHFWVRVSNACGSTDSQTAVIKPDQTTSNGPVKRRGRRID